MDSDQEWNEIRPRGQETSNIGWTAIRVSLLFGSLAIAIALIVTPLLPGSNDSRWSRLSGGVDRMTTATATAADRTYRVRQSVLQPSPTSKCIIYSNGASRGEC